MSDNPSSEAPAEASEGARPPRRLGEIAAAVSAGAAVLGVVVGFLGLPAVLRSPTAKGPAVVTVTVTAPATTSSAPIQSGTAGPSSPSPSVSSSAKATAPQTAEFDLVHGYGFNLDSSPIRPVKTADSGTTDFEWSEFQDVLAASAGQMTNAGQTTLEGCLESTRYSQFLSIYKVEIGQALCVITSTHVGLIEVKGKDPDTTYMTLKVTSWPKP